MALLTQTIFSGSGGGTYKIKDIGMSYVDSRSPRITISNVSDIPENARLLLFNVNGAYIGGAKIYIHDTNNNEVEYKNVLLNSLIWTTVHGQNGNFNIGTNTIIIDILNILAINENNLKYLVINADTPSWFDNCSKYFKVLYEQ